MRAAAVSLTRTGGQKRRVVFDLDSLDNAAGLLNIGHGAADGRLKAIRFPVKSDHRHATAHPRRTVVAPGLEQPVGQFLGYFRSRGQDYIEVISLQ